MTETQSFNLGDGAVLTVPVMSAPSKPVSPVEAAALIADLDQFDTWGCAALYNPFTGSSSTVHRLKGIGAAKTLHGFSDADQQSLVDRHGACWSMDASLYDTKVFSDLSRSTLIAELHPHVQAAVNVAEGDAVILCGYTAGDQDGAPDAVSGVVSVDQDNDRFIRTERAIDPGFSGSAVIVPPADADLSTKGNIIRAMADDRSIVVGTVHSAGAIWSDDRIVGFALAQLWLPEMVNSMVKA